MQFTPVCMVADSTGNLMNAKPKDRQQQVTGEVVYINEAHNWYRVEFRMPGSAGPQYESFPLPVEPDPAWQRNAPQIIPKVRTMTAAESEQ